MRLRGRLPVFLLVLLLSLMLAGCDNGPAPAAPTPNVTSTTEQAQGGSTAEDTVIAAPEATAAMPVEGTAPAATGTIVDAEAIVEPTEPAGTVPTATPVTATGTGEALTALQALEELRGKALEEMPDGRLAMLINSRPGQQRILLGTSLGDPNVNEATPGGLGRNWTLVAVSPSQERAVAFSTDGTVIDMTAAGTVPDELLANFGSPAGAALELATLDVDGLVDSDAIAEAAGERGAGSKVGIALLAPEALGLGSLPAPEAGGASPQLVYELFSTDPATQLFVFFDAKTGSVVLDSGT